MFVFQRKSALLKKNPGGDAAALQTRTRTQQTVRSFEVLKHIRKCNQLKATTLTLHVIN